MGTLLFNFPTCGRQNVHALSMKKVTKMDQRKLHTAISIYVVGSKLQGYGTRPKGGMGRLELILGFRGCRREMDMEAENTISIALRVLKKSNKNRLRSHIPLRSCLVGLRLLSDNVN